MDGTCGALPAAVAAAEEGAALYVQDPGAVTGQLQLCALSLCECFACCGAEPRARLCLTTAGEVSEKSD